MVPDYLEVSLGRGVTVALDLRWMGLEPDLDERLAGPLGRALSELAALEGGAIANADEGRMVGHYWLRAPELAPRAAEGEQGGAGAIERQIRDAWRDVERLVLRLAGRFERVLVVGIGGSALGPQLLSDALGHPGDARRVFFMDNTDPDGMTRVLREVAPLSEVLVVVISKSGGTPETRNGYLVVREAFKAAGLAFAEHAIAVTQEGSVLSGESSKWLARLPMWDWVGGRTSVTSVVGLLPAALQGIDGEALIEGARRMDEATRRPDVAENPAALMALAWHAAGHGRGDKAMVVLPYKDRLMLLSRYLQQLVMESLGKAFDRAGTLVNQGLTVYGNKGSTDQHAYVQQLRDGRDDFFATFVEVLEDGPPDALATSFAVEPGVTSGDYLSGFLAGTRQALADAGRRSLTLTVPWLDASVLGGLIALFERTVSIYASLVNVNAYHQPGVEAGKRAAAEVLGLQKRLVELIADGESGTADDLAALADADPRDVFHVLRHAAANGRVAVEGEGLDRVFSRIEG